MTAATIVFAIAFYAAAALCVGGLAYKIVDYSRTPAPLKIPTTPAPTTAGGVALRVRDTGHGIQEADLPRIFDESFSTRHGGGLGLPIARRIVEAHGGAIRVESTAGRGTTFTVWLPSA